MILANAAAYSLTSLFLGLGAAVAYATPALASARLSAATTMIYILVTFGALGRVAAPLLPVDYMLAVRLSGIAWGGAFLVFLLVYGPKLAGPRPDGWP